MTRTEIISKIRINSGGTYTKTLDELVDWGFVEKYFPYSVVKDALFYLKFTK